MTQPQTIAEVTVYPLSWPDNKPRAAHRRSGPFRTSMSKAQDKVKYEMERIRALQHVISAAPAYARGPVDPGVAVWWETREKNKVELRVMACDTYYQIEHNLHAIALTLEALRACDRYGAYTTGQALEGAKLALPGPAAVELQRPWFEVLGCAEDAPLAVAEAWWKELAKEWHDDHRAMVELNLAIAEARRVKRS